MNIFRKILKFTFLFSILFIPRLNFFKNKEKVGLNLSGLSNKTLGLSVTYKMLSSAISQSKIKSKVNYNNFELHIKKNAYDNRKHNKRFSYDYNIFSVNPDILYKFVLNNSLSSWTKKYNIGFWFWELEKFPISWLYSFKIVDEVWVNTDFVKNSIKKYFKNTIKIPFFVNLSSYKLINIRKDFGLNSSSFIFLFSFDYLSSFHRKNPIAVIESFLMTFKTNQNVKLIIKSINSLHDRDNHNLLIKYAKNCKNILFYDQDLSDDVMKNLLYSVDCYISLHRSEGLGLGIAESMAMGKPVIATAYSGNLEFMNSENSLLVKYKLIKVRKNQYFSHINQFWAEPSIKDASKKMELIFSDKKLRDSLSKNAKLYMKKNHSSKQLIEFFNNRF